MKTIDHPKIRVQNRVPMHTLGNPMRAPLALAIMTGIAVAPPSQAATLYGEVIATALYFPEYGTVVDTKPRGAPYQVVATADSLDVKFKGTAVFKVDFRPQQIVIRIDDSGCCTSYAPFNGISFRLLNQRFVSATLSKTNIPGFDAGRVTLHSPSELLVNIGNGLNLDPPNSTIVIDVTTE